MLLVDGTSAREQPLVLIITTSGKTRENIFDLKYDEATTVINGLFDENGYKDERFFPIVMNSISVKSGQTKAHG